MLPSHGCGMSRGEEPKEDVVFIRIVVYVRSFSQVVLRVCVCTSMYVVELNRSQHIYRPFGGRGVRCWKSLFIFYHFRPSE